MSLLIKMTEAGKTMKSYFNKFNYFFISSKDKYNFKEKCRLDIYI